MSVERKMKRTKTKSALAKASAVALRALADKSADKPLAGSADFQSAVSPASSRLVRRSRGKGGQPPGNGNACGLESCIQ